MEEEPLAAPFQKADITEEMFDGLPDVFVVFDGNFCWREGLLNLDSIILKGADYYLRGCKFNNNYYADVC